MKPSESLLSKFLTLDYLLKGNTRQKHAYHILKPIFHTLAEYQPILAGTIPLDVDLPSSDLDVLLYSENLATLEQDILSMISSNPDNYSFIDSKTWEKNNAIIINISASNNQTLFHIELFGQRTPTQQQLAYKHMIAECSLLDSLSEVQKEIAKKEIRKLKEKTKTEPAFGQYFQLYNDNSISGNSAYEKLESIYNTINLKSSHENIS